MKEFENAVDEKSETKKTSWSVYMDKNIHYVKYFLYGVGIGGLLYAGYSVRLTTKFHTVGAIPNEFFSKQFKLYGNVTSCVPVRSDGNACNVDIHVDHEPIIRMGSFGARFKGLSMFATKSVPKSSDAVGIRIRVPVVYVNDGYFEAVSSKILSRKISFVLYQKIEESDIQFAVALVRFRERGWLTRSVDFGSWIVDNGFGSVAPIVQTSVSQSFPQFGKYYSKLLKLEERAAKRKKGMWKNTTDDVPLKSIPKFTRFIQWILNYIKRVFKRLR
ncbi:unnamed protein product [Orchesella dallaii]|uniref:TNase-like domain-containing protein n=1 Tax=Orchesella dallaii TaxID=48710 RepID=A0ABP1QZK0_9HEXA